MVVTCAAYTTGLIFPTSTSCSRLIVPRPAPAERAQLAAQEHPPLHRCTVLVGSLSLSELFRPSKSFFAATGALTLSMNRCCGRICFCCMFAIRHSLFLDSGVSTTRLSSFPPHIYPIMSLSVQFLHNFLHSPQFLPRIINLQLVERTTPPTFTSSYLPPNFLSFILSGTSPPPAIFSQLVPSTFLSLTWSSARRHHPPQTQEPQRRSLHTSPTSRFHPVSHLILLHSLLLFPSNLFQQSPPHIPMCCSLPFVF